MIGDASLVPQFLDLSEQFQNGSLFITAPFYDLTFMEYILRRFNNRLVRIEVVVRKRKDAEEIFSFLKPQKKYVLSIFVCEILHAKVYIFESGNHDLIGLVGSHNPTIACLRRNLEIGVLIRGRSDSPQGKAIIELKEYLKGCSLPYIV